MRSLKKITAFFYGRTAELLLVIIVAVASLITSILSAASIYDKCVNYLIVKNNKLNNAYLYAFAYTPGIIDSYGVDGMKELFRVKAEEIKNNTIVEKAYTVKISNSIEYNGVRTSIILYENGFIKEFPMLGRFGLGFADDSDGCILTTSVFNEIHDGEYFDVDFYFGQEKTHGMLRSAGHLRYPYKHFEFAGYSSNLEADDVIVNSDVIIMQPDEGTLEMLNRYTNVTYMPDVLFTIRENASPKDVESFINELNNSGYVESFDDVVNNSRETVFEALRYQFIRPFFFMISTVAAFLSIMVVVVNTKRRDMAIAYLCGAQRIDLINTAIHSSIAVCSVPSIIGVAFILLAPGLQWTGRLERFGDGSLITPELIWIVVAYFVLTLIVSVIAVLLTIGRKTPIENLRRFE